MENEMVLGSRSAPLNWKRRGRGRRTRIQRCKPTGVTNSCSISGTRSSMQRGLAWPRDPCRRARLTLPSGCLGRRQRQEHSISGLTTAKTAAWRWGPCRLLGPEERLEFCWAGPESARRPSPRRPRPPPPEAFSEACGVLRLSACHSRAAEAMTGASSIGCDQRPPLPSLRTMPYPGRSKALTGLLPDLAGYRARRCEPSPTGTLPLGRVSLAS